MRKITFVLLIFLLLVCGCVTSAGTVQQKHCVLYWSEDYSINSFGSVSIVKFSIPEDNVTCYIYSGGYDGGMACLRNENI